MRLFSAPNLKMSEAAVLADSFDGQAASFVLHSYHSNIVSGYTMCRF